MLEPIPTVALPLMAAGIGAVHALDADHVMAVSALATRRAQGRGKVLPSAVGWAVGHGLTLLAAGVAVFAIGQALPSSIDLYAERLAAVLLILIGGIILWDLFKGGARLDAHTHPEHTAHMHWTRSRDHGETKAQGAHDAVIVGACHGLAGSAPVLALMPAGARGDVWEGLFVLLAFSVGVLVTMLILGLVFARIIGDPDKPSLINFNWIRSIAGAGSVLLGTMIIWGTL